MNENYIPDGWYSKIDINNPINYLEIGVYNKEHFSGLHTDSKIYIINSCVNQEFTEHIENLVITHGFSHIEIPKLTDNFFDMIRINGNHKHECVLEDAILCFRKLKNGGIMIIDDYGWGGIDGFLYGYHNVIIFLGIHNKLVYIEKC